MLSEKTMYKITSVVSQTIRNCSMENMNGLVKTSCATTCPPICLLAIAIEILGLLDIIILPWVWDLIPLDLIETTQDATKRSSKDGTRNYIKPPSN